jgi:hypothetical protein
MKEPAHSYTDPYRHAGCPVAFRADDAASGLALVERGTHALKGVPDTWQVYAVGAQGS